MSKVKGTVKARNRNMSTDDRLEQICEVASDLFFEKGFWQTTTKEIAEACNISVGTLFYHIKSKYDFPILFTRVHINDVDKWEKEIRDLMDNYEPEQLLGMAVKKFVELLDLRYKIVIFWATVSHHLGWEYLEDMANMDLKIVSLFKDIIDKGYRTGQFKTNNPLLTAINIEVMCHAWIIKGWYLYQFYTLEQYAAICQQHAVLMARGASDLKIPPGIEYPAVEVQHLKDYWNRRRKEKPEGHGSDSWVRSRAK